MKACMTMEVPPTGLHRGNCPPEPLEDSYYCRMADETCPFSAMCSRARLREVQSRSCNNNCFRSRRLHHSGNGCAANRWAAMWSAGAALRSLALPGHLHGAASRPLALLPGHVGGCTCSGRTAMTCGQADRPKRQAHSGPEPIHG